MSGFNANANDSVLNVDTLTNALANANVTVTTGSGGTQAGDITVANDVTWTSGSTLTLSAYRNIAVNANVNISGQYGSLVLRADSAGTGLGTVTFGSGSTATGNVSIYYNPSNYTSPTDYSANEGSSTTLTAYMLVNTLQNLRDVSTNLSGTYALGKDLDASATAGTSFVPIGDTANPFTGTLDGQGHVISGLVINEASDNVGLFGVTSASASIHELGLLGGNVKGQQNVGGLVGSNAGTIKNTYTSLTIDGTQTVGGLVGRQLASASITNSYSLSSVNASGAGAGGLVGSNAARYRSRMLQAASLHRARPAVSSARTLAAR